MKLILITALTITRFTANNCYAIEPNKEYVIIPKFVHPFFERTRQGCLKAASELGVNCRYEPPQKFDIAEQAKLLTDILNQDVAGVAIAPISSVAIARIIKNNNHRNIPIVTFDSDLQESDKSARATYVGSNNKQIGIELGNLLNKIKPSGGTIAIQAGEPPAENLKERLEGLRGVLDSTKWQEVAGSPHYCNADSQVAVQQLEDILNKHPDLTAFVALGAWPQVAKQGYKQVVSRHIAKVQNNELIILVADTLTMQMELLAENYCHGLVGQRPTEMGYQAIKILKDLNDNKTPADPIYTGLDICTRDNVAECVK